MTHGQEVGVPLSLRILDEDEAQELSDAAVDDALREAWARAGLGRTLRAR